VATSALRINERICYSRCNGLALKMAWNVVGVTAWCVVLSIKRRE
jgi:hypothetical protein